MVSSPQVLQYTCSIHLRDVEDKYVPKIADSSPGALQLLHILPTTLGVFGRLLSFHHLSFRGMLTLGIQPQLEGIEDVAFVRQP